MALSDPQTVTISGTAYPLPRVGMGDSSGVFRSADGITQMAVRHTYGKRVRRNLKLTFNKVAPDPFQTDVNTSYNASVNFTIDHPAVGFTSAELKGIVDGLTAYLTATSGAVVTKIVGGES
jgi:hypothetical protein